MKYKKCAQLIFAVVVLSQYQFTTNGFVVESLKKTIRRESSGEIGGKHSLFGSLKNQWSGNSALNLKNPRNLKTGATFNPANFDSDGDRSLNVPIRSIGEIIFPNLARSVCGAWDSCVLRCGDPILGAPYLCSCDANCEIFEDCCVDHKYYCGNGSTAKAENLPIAAWDLDADDAEREESISALAQTLADLGNSNFLPVFIGPNNEPEPQTFIIEKFIKRSGREEEGGQINKGLLECRQVEESPYYGVWFFDGINVNRKCIIKGPPWCEAEYYMGDQHLDWDFTQSLSILLNFGPVGWNNDLLFSQDYYNPDRCPSVWEIWDPFTQICRPIECNPDFVLEDGECVWDGDSPTPPDSYALLGYKTKTANISFSGNILMPDSWAQMALPILNFDIAESFSTKIRLNEDRINVAFVIKDSVTTQAPRTTTETPITSPTATTKEGATTLKRKTTTGPVINGTEPPYDTAHLWVLSEHGFPITVNMTLERRGENVTDELTIEQVLSVLHEAVSIRAVLRTIKGVPMKINSVEKTLQKEEIDFFTKWCRGGDLNSYWNEEFEVLFVMKNKTDANGTIIGTKLEMDIQINDSGQRIPEGQYVANLLYQSSDMISEAANVSGVVVVCENRPLIRDMTCPRISLNETEFDIDADGSLIYEGDIPGVRSPLNRTEYEYTDNGNVKICINYKEAKASLDLGEPTLAEKIASCLTMTLVVLSLIGLLLTIITYGLFSELRTLPGWCLIHLCIAEFAFFLLFISGARRPTSENDFACTAVAVSLHFTALLFFTWSSVISYDLFTTFTKFQVVTRSREKYLWRYTIVGYGVPLFIIFSCLMVEFHANHIISYGHHAICWIGNSMASLYVFALPISISILVNAGFFILAVRGIRTVSATSTGLRGSRERARFSLYIRMSSIQCFAWIFGFLTVITHFDGTLSTLFEFAFLILSSLQGLYIFFAFVYNERVKQLYRSKAFCKSRTELNRDRTTVISRSQSQNSGGNSNSTKTPSATSATTGTTSVAKNKIPRHILVLASGQSPAPASTPTTPNPTSESRIKDRDDTSKIGKSKPRRKLSGNRNLPAERTVSNETIISIISDQSQA